MHTKCASWCCIKKIKVKIQHIHWFTTDFIAYKIHQHITFLQLILNNPQDGQHIFLLGQFYTIIYLTIEMNGQVADLQ